MSEERELGKQSSQEKNEDNKESNASSINSIYKKYKILYRSQSVPDFNSYLSRDRLNNLFKKKDRITNGDISPNYKSIESGVKMMVKYSKNYNDNSKYNKKRFKGINYEGNYNANEAYEKIYGHKIRVAPAFQKMTPRPEDNDLPFFLNGITNRMIYNNITYKTLKMNSYFNGKIYNICNDLKQKKNKYKNLRLDAVRKSLNFNSSNNYDKNKIKRELAIRSKKFDNIFIKKNNNY